MNDTKMTIRQYLPGDEREVIGLWKKCELTRPWNNPVRDIQRKLKVDPELFLVGLVDGKVMATVMGGYDGHRGWIHSLAVDPSHQREGLGRQIMDVVEKKISVLGCPKINLQVRADNSDVVRFYESIGYKVEERISMGKSLIEDG